MFWLFEIEVVVYYLLDIDIIVKEVNFEVEVVNLIIFVIRRIVRIVDLLFYGFLVLKSIVDNIWRCVGCGIWKFWWLVVLFC